MAGRRPTGKIPFGQFFAYGVGGWANQVFDSGIGNLAFYVFNIGLGVDPFLVGLAQSLARGVDLVTDPLAGYLSDALRPRFGLRAFIACGSVAGGLAFALVWLFPFGWTPAAYFVWLLVCFAICSAAWSVFSVPRYALGFELTADPHERNKLMTFSAFMMTLCNLGLAWSYRIIQWRVFGTPLRGARWVGGAMGAAIIVFGLVSVAGRRRRPPVSAAPTPAGGHPGAGLKDFFRSIRGVLRSRPFAVLAGSVALTLFGVIGTYAVGPYLLIYYVCGGDQKRGAEWIAYCSTSWILSGIVLAPLVLWLSRRIGKRNTMVAFLGLAFASSFVRWLFYNPAHPWIALVPFGCFGAGIGGLAAMAPSMTADICDWEEYSTGRRQGGLFSAFYSWTLKVGMTTGFAIAGLLLDLTGFHAGAKGAMPTAAMIVRMRAVDSAFPALILGAALLLLRRYRITPETMLEVRVALEARRGLTAPAES